MGQTVKPEKAFDRYVLGEISENYRRVFNDTEKAEHEKYQLLCDAISGMTENYLIDKYDEFELLDNEKA